MLRMWLRTVDLSTAANRISYLRAAIPDDPTNLADGRE
jgi:hypothetical protein